MLPQTKNASHLKGISLNTAELSCSMRSLASGLIEHASRTADVFSAIHSICKSVAIMHIERSLHDVISRVFAIAGTVQEAHNPDDETLEYVKSAWAGISEISLGDSPAAQCVNEFGLRTEVIKRIDELSGNESVHIKAQDLGSAMNRESVAVITPSDQNADFDFARAVEVIVNKLAFKINEWAVSKGFWGTEDKLIDMISTHTGITSEEKTKLRIAVENLVKTEKQMLVVTEGAELIEGLRKGTNTPDQHCPEFSNEEIESADQIIRILDLCARKGWRIGAAIGAKMSYNCDRPEKHGKEF